MRITGVKTVIVGNPWKNWLFALVETDEGITGIGEGSVMAFARTVETAIHELGPFYLGQDPFQPALIVQRMTRDVFEFNVEWEGRIAIPPARVVDGFIEIPDRPGLGIELDLEEIALHPYQETAFLPLFRPGWERRDPVLKP